MEISTKSWHYRLINKTWGKPASNLCGYFWETVFSVIFVLPFLVLSLPFLIVRYFFLAKDKISLSVSALFGFLISAVILCVGISIYTMIGMFFVKDLFEPGIIFWIIYIIVGIIFYIISREDKPSLVGRYIAAKKSKVCPIIEFKD